MCIIYWSFTFKRVWLSTLTSKLEPWKEEWKVQNTKAAEDNPSRKFSFKGCTVVGFSWKLMRTKKRKLLRGFIHRTHSAENEKLRRRDKVWSEAMAEPTSMSRWAGMESGSQVGGRPDGKQGFIIPGYVPHRYSHSVHNLCIYLQYIRFIYMYELINIYNKVYTIYI